MIRARRNNLVLICRILTVILSLSFIQQNDLNARVPDDTLNVKVYYPCGSSDLSGFPASSEKFRNFATSPDFCIDERTTNSKRGRTRHYCIPDASNPTDWTISLTCDGESKAAAFVSEHAWESDKNYLYVFVLKANELKFVKVISQDDYFDFNDIASGTDIRHLKDADDIVHLNWPEGWSIPTAKDFELLRDNTSVSQETDANGKLWFRLTATDGSGNSIKIPATGYIDSAENSEKNNSNAWSSTAYLQSSTMGTSSTSVKGEITGTYVTKRTIYALNLSGTTAKLVSTAGRATGLMVRPVKYVRVE